MSIRSIPRAALLASTLLASTSIPALAGDVTSQRLMNPDKEPQNWLMVNKATRTTARIAILSLT